MLEISLFIQIPERFKVTKEMVHTAEAHQNSTDLLLNLGIVSHYINTLFYHADNTHYKDAAELHTILCNSLASQWAIGPLTS